MTANLVIVESPAKSATIKKFLGEGFEVKASFGHVVDLPQKEMGIDIEHNFAPKYQVSPDKVRVVNELKALAKKADKVWIATDEDREGEAIGRHVANQLGLDIKKTSRIVFHEITKNAIDHAIKNPRTLDMNLVDAQQARRVLDRLVWFELSPVLRTKVKGWLSAGRVQSVAVKLLVEREREIQKFESESFFKVIWDFVGDAKKDFKAELSKDPTDKAEAEKFLNHAKDSAYTVESVEVRPGKKSPSAPFTTSTLQQEASRKLGFPVARTMQVAQKLYEAGHITYMRTDSVNLSDFAVKEASDQVKKLYGNKYSNPTHYVTKSKWSQEAHECIRPTHMEHQEAGSDPAEKKLYNLIRKRTITSQMTPASIEKTKAMIDISGHKLKFIASGEVIKFDGFLKVYFESSDEENEEGTWMLPLLKEGEKLDMQQIAATQKFKNHPPRYTEASLVKKMEELGIGRPSTYAPTISTVQKRGYVVNESREGTIREFVEMILAPVIASAAKQSEDKYVITTSTKKQNTWAEKQKLFPTDIGMLVTDFLGEHFKDIMDYNFTAKVEEDFDEIAEGKIKRAEMLKKFYGPFHKEVVATKDADRQSGERSLWIDPNSWLPVIARIGRFGPMVQIGKNEGEKKAKFASVPPGKSIETITLQEALDAFNGPRVVGKYKWEEVTASTGKFGPYVKYGKTYVSIRKWSELDYTTITIEQAIPLIEAKLEVDKNKNINSFDYPAKDGTGAGKKIEVLNGMYGPYIKYGGYNYRIPKGGKDATDMTLEDCAAIVDKKNNPIEKADKKTEKAEKKIAKKSEKPITKKIKKKK